MTRLTKPVTRETDARGWRRKRNLIVSLLPGDLIELREKGTRKRWTITIEAVYDIAVKAEVAMAKRAKAEARKARRANTSKPKGHQ